MSHKTHPQGKDFLGEHSIGDLGQVIVLLVFFTVWILDGFVFKIGTSLNLKISLYIRLPFVVILMLTSLFLAIKSIKTIFVEKRDKPELIRSGLYGIVRHPMYLSELLLYLAFICLNISFFSIAIYALSIIFFYHICRYEENILYKHFGEEYAEYKKSVGMWIPRLRKKHA